MSERLTEAMARWLEHRRDPDCSDDELLARHPQLQDLLAPLVDDARAARAARDDPPAGEGDGVDGPRDFGMYRLLGEIDRGGVGVVYEAIQQPLGRRVALKMLADALVLQPTAVARFRREGELLARLQHAHVVPVYDAGVVGGIPFHAMERIDGTSLQNVLARLRGGSPDRRDGASLCAAMRALLGDETAGEQLRAKSHVEAALLLVRAVASALEYAHGHGILHRDVKPANILLRRDGTAMLSDFGLARDRSEPGLTHPGGFVGTAFYVSPEQADGRGDEVDERSDVFSLAVVLYELLWLERPFDGETTEAVLDRVRHAEPPALRRSLPGVPADLMAVLDRALQKRPQDRYPSVRAFADELLCVVELRPVRARRRGPFARALQVVRRRPRQSALWFGLLASAITAASLFVYVNAQAGRIAAARHREDMPKVEHHLELAMLDQEGNDWDDALREVIAADAILPDMTEVLAAKALLHLVRNNREPLAACVARLDRVDPDVARQFAEPDPPEPETYLGWFVRGMRALGRGHHSGDPAQFQVAARALRRTIDRAPEPRSLFHCQYLHALLHVRDEAALRAMADDVLHLWPESQLVAYWRGFAMQNYEPELARAELERALRIDPTLHQARWRLAKVFETTGDLEAAERELRRLLDERPQTKLARITLSRVLRLQHKHRQALDQLDVSGDVGGSGEIGSRWLVERATVLANMRRFDEARQLAQQAVEAAPLSPLVHFKHAHVSLQARQLDEALAMIDIACRMAPTNFRYETTRAMVHVARRDWPQAERSFERVVELHPAHVDAWCDLGSIRRRLRDHDGAAVALAKARDLDPDHANMHLQSAHLAKAQGDAVLARREFELALANNADDFEARINLAGYHFEDGDDERALELLARAREIRPGLWQAWSPSIANLTRLGRHVEAEQLMRAWCERFPRNGHAWISLARLRRKSPDHDLASAQRAIDRAAGIFGEHAGRVLAERGLQALAGGDRSAARRLLERALATDGLRARDRDECRARLAELAR